MTAPLERGKILKQTLDVATYRINKSILPSTISTYYGPFAKGTHSFLQATHTELVAFLHLKELGRGSLEIAPGRSFCVQYGRLIEYLDEDWNLIRIPKLILQGLSRR